MEKIIIVAVAANNVIGADGKIPWHSKEELQHFKNTTMGFPIIMGRHTFESIGKPLKGRLNIVVTKKDKSQFGFEELTVVRSLDEAFEVCEKENFEKIFVIGGGMLYKEAYGICDKLIVTKMNFEAEGDTFFPEISGSEWNLENQEKYSDFTVNYFIKKK